MQDNSQVMPTASHIGEHVAYLGLGSNLGDGHQNIAAAVLLIGEKAGEILAEAPLIESEPWGFESEHRFTNGAVAIRTSLSPMELLDVTQQIERQMGRTHKHRPGESYTDRIIDIDLLEYDDLQMDTPRLTLPHPLISQRDFVSIPLEECRLKVLAQEE